MTTSSRTFTLTELASTRLIADWQAANPSRTLTWPGYGRAPAKIMRLFLSDLAGRYGSVHNYAVNHVGVDRQLITTLRGQLLTRSNVT